MIGTRIAKLRKEKNLSAIKLSELVGCSRQTVNWWELGLQNPRAAYREILAEVLDTTVMYLETGLFIEDLDCQKMALDEVEL